MFGLAANQWLAIFGGMLLLAWQLWPSLGPLLAKLNPFSGTAVDQAATSRVKAVECIDYLLEFFKDCPEGKAAVETAGAHLFHAHAGG